MKIAIIGATGLVGSVLLKVLEERNIDIERIYFVASEKSIGKTVYFKNKPYEVIGLKKAVEEKPNIAIFSAGGVISKEWATKFAENGTTVIDNSSAWRMHNKIPLIVPEINANILSKNHKIIANPNCSTIQMVMALAPLHRKYGIKRLVVSTYQSVSGSGIKAIEQMENERNGITGEMVYPYKIDTNILPHGGDFLENDYTSEEQKLIDETRKILNDYNLKITSTIVRVPVKVSHSESVNAELKKDYDIEDIKKLLNNEKGVIVMDDPKNSIYPMPITAEGKDEVFVGRLRRDYSCENSLNMWIVSDNLRKGAATNAIQIAEYLIKNELV